MSSLGKELQGTIGAVQRMAQNVAIALGASISATIIRLHLTSGSGAAMQGFRLAFVVATNIVFFSLLCFAFTWKHRPDKEPAHYWAGSLSKRGLFKVLEATPAFLSREHMPE